MSFLNLPSLTTQTASGPSRLTAHCISCTCLPSQTAHPISDLFPTITLLPARLPSACRLHPCLPSLTRQAHSHLAQTNPLRLLRSSLCSAQPRTLPTSHFIPKTAPFAHHSDYPCHHSSHSDYPIHTSPIRLLTPIRRLPPLAYPHDYSIHLSYGPPQPQMTTHPSTYYNPLIGPRLTYRDYSIRPGTYPTSH